jgi:hypothetical protein
MTDGPSVSAAATSSAIALVPLPTTYTASTDSEVVVLYGGNAAVSKPWLVSQVLTSLAPCAVVVPLATSTLIDECGTGARVVVVTEGLVVVVDVGAVLP